MELLIGMTVLVCLAVAILPWQGVTWLIWSIWLFVLSTFLTHGRVHWSDQGLGVFFAYVLLICFVGLPSLTFLVRWCIRIGPDGPSWAATPDESAAPQKRSPVALWSARINAAFFIAWGVVLAGITFRVFASIGAPAGVATPVHVILGVTACAGGVALLRSPWGEQVFGGTYCATLLALTCASALWYPHHIETRAAHWATGAKDTQLADSRSNRLTHWSQLTFLTAPKGNRLPHFTLSFQTPDGTCTMAWSYAYGDFRTDNYLIDSRPCPAPS